MFASKTLPKHLPGHRDNDGCVFPDLHFSPRQRNDANPILVAFRGYEERHPLDTHRLYWLAALDSLATFGGFREWDRPGDEFHALTLATDEQAEHARKVLTRLANLQAVTS